MTEYFEEPIELEINGILDLHHFSPKEVKYLVADYLAECLKKEIYQVRIIHGKGTGALRKTVHAVLERNVAVQSYRMANENEGSWGATVVTLSKAVQNSTRSSGRK
jgi:dsDNA-specific endonuclease/ATPase MutS2